MNGRSLRAGDTRRYTTSSEEWEMCNRRLRQPKRIIIMQQATQQELRTAERPFYEPNQRLQDAINAKDGGKMTVVQGILDVANPKMEAVE